MKLNILCIGDIVGRPGRRALADKLKALVAERSIDCVIANAENAAGGSGLTPQIYEKLLRYGVNIITLGDHAFRKRDIIETLERSDNVARPANFSEQAAGRGTAIYKTAKGPTVGVVSLIGRLFMKPADCPYATADKLIPRLRQQAEIIVVEMHAEATSEKVAMGYHVDGRTACCFGTHTHIPTADERILPKGTAYISDVGMTGAHDSVLGRKKESVLKSFRTQMPVPFEIATDDIRINAALIMVESGTGKAERIERIRVDVDTTDNAGYDSDDGRPEYFNAF
ncbi:MAG TPA: TIGR00282 family metallophosphoesterase [Sedimentisphaerales bacterium]|nr:TIGR00282 family metallophosphoesterase [Sedimentisphaerales bacterium]HOV76842.1 TIGR00282 family metallophosphoesterase [Sedimentisphaerales bacterium]